MNNYLSGIMALAQMTPEQFDLGRQRYQTLSGMFSGVNQAPSLNQQPTGVNGVGSAPQATLTSGTASPVQPAMTQAQPAEGGFGTGPTPYSQPYYQSSFANRNPYFGGYGMGYQPAPFMPMGGRTSGYGSSGKGGSYNTGYGKGGGFR